MLGVGEVSHLSQGGGAINADLALWEGIKR
jgi:hypothetical protein